MKLKYHKIRNVPKEVCTAEQMIAYNMAWRAHISFQDDYDRAKTISAICVDDVVQQAIAYHLMVWERDYCSPDGSHYKKSNAKLNIDAIKACLQAGMKGYFEKHFIASDYDRVGKAFPAYYL